MYEGVSLAVKYRLYLLNCDEDESNEEMLYGVFFLSVCLLSSCTRLCLVLSMYQGLKTKVFLVLLNKDQKI